jgi:polyphenol oxidase
MVTGERGQGDAIMITLNTLDDGGAVRHAFFTRRGGVSRGLFESLNCGFGSGDAADSVARNRTIAMARLSLSADRLATCHQIHSASAIAVEKPWSGQAAPRADGMVTRMPNIALGILTADCAPILFHDPVAGVIGAAHGGWRGALAGIVEATIAQMETIGAERSRIRAGIGPCIAQNSYEVGPEFPGQFLAQAPACGRYFAPTGRLGHFMFDLPGYIEHRLARAGVAIVQRSCHDTVTDDDHFFSYRRACLRGEPAYGRGLSAIVLEA